MESELQKFRRRKLLEEKKEEIKNKFRTTANSWARTFYQALLPNWNENEDEEEEEIVADNGEEDVGPNSSSLSSSEQDGTVNTAANLNKWILYLVFAFRFLAWLLAYIGFLKIGFGAVFFTISLLFFIYWNTRQSKGRKRRKGEVSAYSVFNKDCQSIDGTLKAEHLEKQLLYRS